MITAETILAVGGVLGALGVIWASVYGIVKWIQKREGDSEALAAFRKQHEEDIAELKEDFRREIAELKVLHNSDIEKGEEREKEELKAVQEELCVLSYAMLAALDGLKQLQCNGEVSKAHEKLERHLNLRAHDQ